MNEQKKHYTSKELTGLTKKQHKKADILYKLMIWFMEHKNYWTDKELEEGRVNVKISRFDLHRLHNIDRHQFSRDVNTLLNERHLLPNPTSHISKNGHLLPNNDTKYYINQPLVTNEWERLMDIRDQHTMKVKGKKTTHMLDSYLDK